ncbi:MAG: hypothetical protein AMJ91_04740 [candidate division Zixibacteria bacterium SM23_73_3]|nr:MAG: hypothetical protein AMJ91_04740 [candidate division Zixibacteria bacterium SM23_73_3]
MKKLPFALFGCFFLIVSTISATAREIKKDFHESFDVREGVVLHLKHGGGDVTITPWDKDVVDVEVHYRADSKLVGLGGKHDFDVEFRQNDDAIHVIGKEKSSSSIGFSYFKRYEYTYTIQAPKYLELNLEGDDGDVDIENWQGKIDCRLDDGDVDLQDIFSKRTRIRIADGDLEIDGIQGNLLVDGDDGDIVIAECKSQQCRIRLEDGDVTIKRSEGDFEIDVDDGDVELYQLRAGKLDIRTKDGDIDLDLLKSSEIDLDIIAEDGDVTVDLEVGISAIFSVDTDDGRIRVDLPDADLSRNRRHQVSGEIHGGKGRIRIRTADGNVILRESE